MSGGGSSIPLPPKPNGTVTIGRPIKVVVNCFAFQNIPRSKVYHYDVTIGRSGKSGAELEARPSKSGQGTVRGMPERLSRGVIAWMERNQLYSPRAGYDGNKSIYSPQPLVPQGEQLPIEAHKWSGLPIPEEGNTSNTEKAPLYDVEFKKVNVIDMEDLVRFTNGECPENEAIQTCIMALNTIFNNQQWMKYPSKRTSFFDPSIQRAQAASAPPPRMGGGRGRGRGGPRGGGYGGGGGGPPPASEVLGYPVNRGVEVWRGYYTSIRPVSGGIVLNVDVTHMPFLTGNSLQRVMTSLLGLTDDRDLSTSLSRFPSFRQLKQLLTNCRISYQQGDQKVHRVIKEIGRTPADRQNFEVDGQNVSVVEYWNRTYNVRLRHPDWPCVRVTKNAWIPIECCQVEVGNKFKASLTPDQISSAIRFTTLKPGERDSFIRRIDCIRPEVNPILRDANMSIAPEPMTIDGTVLKKPTLLFHDRSRQEQDAPISDRGEWRPAAFTKPAVLNHWIVAVFASPNQIGRHDVQTSVGVLTSAMRDSGIDCRNQQPDIHFCERRDSANNWDVVNSFKAWGGDYKARTGYLPEFILCYLGVTGATTPEHQAIKKFGDKEFGVATQCVSVAKLMGPKGNNTSRQYWSNLCLKINPKLRNLANPSESGMNHFLDKPSWAGIDSEPTMIVGADCTHPAPGSREPSFSAVVGSIDRSFVQFTSTYGVQQSRMETIENMKEKMMKVLYEFTKKNRRVPRRLIVYRDGVSEGQYQEVLAREVPEVRAALEAHQDVARSKDPNIPITPCDITYVICAKRHHIRFKPANDREGDRTGNVPAGTYVDQHVTVPNAWSFYLLSHQGLLGTSRPTLYTVIKDDNRLSLNQMAQLTNSLCYIYARATRAVSIATPAYYAHHACTRAKELSAPPASDDSSSNFSRESDESAERSALFNNYVKYCGDPHANIVNTLYFM